MRVLLTLHHHLDPNLGAPGATLALGDALQAQGCTVEYWGFERAFPEHHAGWGVSHSIRFPQRTASFLRRYARDFDVIDASTGDAWLWAAQGRPGGGSCALVTRSHGLEHTADQQVRAEARTTGRRLSWKYPLYHGGWRLYEVASSLRNADACILLNEADRDYTQSVLKVPAARLFISPMGVADYFFGAASRPLARRAPDLAAGEPLRMAYLSSWIPRKGSLVLAEALRMLAERGLTFELTAFGTGSADEKTVQADFATSVRSRVHVVPRFKHTELPGLLDGMHVLLFPSLSEGFSRALVEAMACGLAPIATAVGGAPAVLREGENGLLIPPGDAAALADAVSRLVDGGRVALDTMRERARETAGEYRWDAIARQTIDVYEAARRTRGVVHAGTSLSEGVRNSHEEAATR